MRQSPIFAALLSLASLLSAQDTTIHIKVPLVVVSTSVTAHDGHSLDGLTPSDFLLFDNGTARDVRVQITDSDSVPIALIIAIQSSGFSDTAIRKIHKSASTVSQLVLGANGEAAVVAFDEQVRLVQDFTQDQDRLTDAIESFGATQSSGESRMVDAVDRSLEMLRRRSSARRSCILLISEARDHGSESKLADVLAKLQKTDTVVYGLTYRAQMTAFTSSAKDYVQPEMFEEPGIRESGNWLPIVVGELLQYAGKNTVAAFTAASGGRSLSFETLAKLENDLIAIASDIHNRYILSFTPDTTTDSTFHALQIKIKNHPSAIVKARAGYWSEPVKN